MLSFLSALSYNIIPIAILIILGIKNLALDFKIGI